MSCNLFVHADPTGGSKYISGTTCDGTPAFYTLTLGQSVCMDTSKPFTDLCGLVISGACQTVTPTPTITPANYCIVSGLTFSQQPFECPFDGVTYFDTYGKLKFTATANGQIVDVHPVMTIFIGNGTETATVTIQNNETYQEFNYIKNNFVFSAGTCQNILHTDWYVISGNSPFCVFLTPTPTLTPTTTPTPTNTLTMSPTFTSTPTITPTRTQTQTPTQTQTSTQTSTPTNTSTQTPTPTQTPTNTSTQTTTPTQTPTPTVTPSPTPPISQFNVCESSDSTLVDPGIYVRATTASGSTFSFGYYSATTFGQTGLIEGYYVLGVAPDGNNYPIYQVNNFGNWNTWSRLFTGSTDFGWSVMEQFQNPLISGSTIIGGSAYGNFSGQTNGSGVIYPVQGQQFFSGQTTTPLGLRVFVTYDPICPTPTQTSTPTNTPTNTQTPSNTPTQTPTNTQTSTPTNTATQTQTPTPSITASQTQTPTNTSTQTQTPTPSITASQTMTPTNTSTQTQTPTPSITASQTQTPTSTQTPTNTSTQTQTPTASITASQTQTPTPSITASQTATPTNTMTPTNTATQTQTPTPSITASQTQTPTPSITASQTQTPTPSITASQTQTSTPTNTPTQTNTPTNTATQTATRTQTPTPSITASQTQTPSPTRTSTPTSTPPVTPTPTIPACNNYELTNNSSSGTIIVSYTTCADGGTVTRSVPPSSTVYQCSRSTPVYVSGPFSLDVVNIGLCPTPTPTATQTPTPTPSITASQTQTPTPSITASQTQTPTNTATQTQTPSNTATQTQTPTRTPTLTPTTTLTATPVWTYKIYNQMTNNFVVTDLTSSFVGESFTMSYPVSSGQTGLGTHTATGPSGGFLLYFTGTQGFMTIRKNGVTIVDNYPPVGSSPYGLDAQLRNLSSSDSIEIYFSPAAFITPTPTPTLTRTPTNTPSITPTNTNTPTGTATQTPTLTQTPTKTRSTCTQYRFNVTGFGTVTATLCGQTTPTTYPNRQPGDVLNICTSGSAPTGPGFATLLGSC